ncbi:MAG: hypothetical protein ACYSWW_01460, partial [Planctomycetota bacterium]
MSSIGTVLSHLWLSRLFFVARYPGQSLRIESHKSWGTILLLLTVLLSGCRTQEVAAPPADYYYLNPDKRLTSVGRVAVVELENDSSYPQMSADITGSLFRA